MTKVVFDKPGLVWLSIAVTRLKQSAMEKAKKAPKIKKDSSYKTITALHDRLDTQKVDPAKQSEFAVAMSRSEIKLLKGYAETQIKALTETVIPKYEERLRRKLANPQGPDKSVDYVHYIDKCKVMMDNCKKVIGVFEENL